MAKRRIGVKYCGGCNPNYERVELVQRVQSQTGDRFLFLRYDDQDLDGRIALSGCQRACAVGDPDQREIPFCSITEEGAFGRVMEWLSVLAQERTRE
jgi:hypothetical protein